MDIPEEKIEVKTNGQSKVRPDIYLTETDFDIVFCLPMFVPCDNFMLWSVFHRISNCGHYESLIVIPLFSSLSV